MSSADDSLHDVRAAVDRWMAALDAGDLDGVVDCASEHVVQANDGAATVVGREALRAKYAPRIAAYRIRSGWDEEHAWRSGDLAVVVGRYTVTMTHREDGTEREAKGRVSLTYRREEDGRWRIVADVDND